MSTSAEKLAALETAIDAFISGGAVQSYTADGVTVTKANLAALLAYRDKLRAEVARGTVHGRQHADLRGYS